MLVNSKTRTVERAEIERAILYGRKRIYQDCNCGSLKNIFIHLFLCRFGFLSFYKTDRMKPFLSLVTIVYILLHFGRRREPNKKRHILSDTYDFMSPEGAEDVHTEDQKAERDNRQTGEGMDLLK